MIVYHGTSTVHLNSINKNKFKINTWFAIHQWHGYQLAEKTSKRDGGKPIILEIEIDEKEIERIVGRNKPSYQYKGREYKITNIITSFSFPYDEDNIKVFESM